MVWLFDLEGVQTSRGRRPLKQGLAWRLRDQHCQSDRPFGHDAEGQKRDGAVALQQHWSSDLQGVHKTAEIESRSGNEQSIPDVRDGEEPLCRRAGGGGGVGVTGGAREGLDSDSDQGQVDQVWGATLMMIPINMGK